MTKTTQRARTTGWLFARDWRPNFRLEVPDIKVKLLDKYERWRKVSSIIKVGKEARQRLEWVIYYHEGHTAVQTTRHFGITRKTFHKWFREFDEDNIYSLRKLADRSRAPFHARQWTLTPDEVLRIVSLRKRYPRWGSRKLARRYQAEYGSSMSSWHIQRVIQKKKLYWNPNKIARVVQKRRWSRDAAQKKKRLTELKQLPFWQKKSGYIICMDTIELRWNSLKRYLFTAVDKYGKVAFARMYTSKSTLQAEDFLHRLHLLMDGRVPRVGHDNGSEFKKLFSAACRNLKIEQYWSRVKTPKDNAENERFNRTIQEEFIALGNFHSDPAVFNKRLTEWLIEYNFKRPHETLNYKTPIECSHLSPMCPSCTRS